MSSGDCSCVQPCESISWRVRVPRESDQTQLAFDVAFCAADDLRNICVCLSHQFERSEFAKRFGRNRDKLLCAGGEVLMAERLKRIRRGGYVRFVTARLLNGKMQFGRR